jgi:hypothetical protein
MTRLRQPQRQVLDTLVDAGVARSARKRWPGACAWSASTPEDWLGSLREAMAKVDELRTEGPDLQPRSAAAARSSSTGADRSVTDHASADVGERARPSRGPIGE